MPRRLFFLLALALGLAITSCHPAGQDFQDCLSAAHLASGPTALPDPDQVTACMVAHGWRPMRPHTEPGPSGWARTR